MTDPDPDSAPRPRGSLARDVAVIVLVGVALGVVHNAYLLGSGPRAGLSWIKSERRLVKLEEVLPADPPPAAVPAPPGAASPPRTAIAGPAAGAHAAAPEASAGAAPRTAATHTAVDPTAAGKPATPAAGSSPVASASGGMSLAPGTPPPPAGTSGGIPVAPADGPAIPETKEPLETGLATVRKLHAANAALFVDARTAGEYAEGHIAGALHLSFDDVFRDPGLAKQLDDRGLPIVAYCGGGDCDLSRNLAFSLIDAGHKRVLVFLDGLPAWESAGLPVHKGPQP